MHREAVMNRRLFTAYFIQELSGVTLLFPTLVLHHQRGEFHHPACMEQNIVSKNTKLSPSKEVKHKANGIQSHSKQHQLEQQGAVIARLLFHLWSTFS